MSRLHEGRPSLAPRVPGGVVGMQVVFDGLRRPAREPPRNEFFIAGTEQAVQRASAQVNAQGPRSGPLLEPGRFGITSPRDGSLFAIDPDIPPIARRITFEGEHGTWLLDGKRLGTSTMLTWAPWPGRHALTLQGREGETIETMRFEVRGVGVKAAQAPHRPRRR